MHHFDLNDLSLFLTIADKGNLTKGAEHFGLSAPSASSRMKKLEDSLQTSLFQRSARGVELTEAGERVYETSRKIMWELESLKSSLRPYVRHSAGQIKVSANYGAALDFLPHDIGDFLLTHPYMKFELTQQSSPEVVNAVISGQADIGVCASDEKRMGVEFYPYKEDELVLITPKGHPISNKSKVFFQEVLDYPFVALTTGSAMQRFVQDNAKRIGKKINIKVQVDNPDILINLVSSGVGIAIILKKSLERADTSKLSVIRLFDDWAQRHLKVVVSEKRSRANQGLADFKEFLLRRKATG